MNMRAILPTALRILVEMRIDFRRALEIQTKLGGMAMRVPTAAPVRGMSRGGV